MAADCARCDGTQTIEVHVDPQATYFWPPLKCAVCNPRGEVRPHHLNRVEFERCPDCATEISEDEYPELRLVRADMNMEEVVDGRA